MPATMLELLDSAVARFGPRPALSMRRDDGTLEAWTYEEFERRTRIAAWRLRALGLEPGDRILTWAPSCPELAATYFGAMRARLITVPLDLRMSADAISGVVTSAAPRQLILGTGRDAPDPHDVGLDRLPTTTVDALTAEPDATFPADWEAQVAAWERPKPDEIFELIFTSGTTSAPKGVMLGHDNVVASIHSFSSLVPPMDHRLVSLLPLSHLLEQSVGLFYAMSVGADIHYVRSRNPRVIFDALRERRVTSMVLVPQFIDLFWSSLQREVDKRGLTRLVATMRPIARRLPIPVRRLMFRSIHSQLGGSFRLFLSAGAYLPPAVQQAWEDIGVTILQGYGSTETGTGCCTTLDDHGLGTVGRPAEGMQVKLADDGEIPVQGTDPVPRLLERARQDRRGVHRRRVVSVRGHRPLRRQGPADPVGPQEGHHRPAERLQRLSRGYSRMRSGSRASAIRSCSRRRPGGSRRSSCGRPSPPTFRVPTRPRPRTTPERFGRGWTRRSRPPTRHLVRTSGSPRGGCGPMTTSRGRTRSR